LVRTRPPLASSSTRSGARLLSHLSVDNLPQESIGFWKLADDQRDGLSRPDNVPYLDRLGSVWLERCRPRFRGHTVQGGSIHARGISGGGPTSRRRDGGGQNTVETPSDCSISPRTTSSAGTLVGRAPGGDVTRDHAFLPRFAWQAVDGSVPSPVNPDRSADWPAGYEASLRPRSCPLTSQSTAVLTSGPLLPSHRCPARAAPS
jgi:hypothetical protein